MTKKLKEIIIDEAIYPNIGIANSENPPVKVKGGIVGQRVEVVPNRKRGGFLEAKFYNLLEKSPMEINEGCIHKEICGGCVYQGFTYKDELEYKKSQIKKLFSTHDIEIDEIIGSPDYKAYRNKMEYTFGDEFKGSELALGMHRKNRFYEVINNTSCEIVHEDFNTILKAVRNYFIDSEYTFVNKKSHEGNLRHLVVRRSELGEILINLVMTTQRELEKERFVEFLLGLKLVGEVKSIFLTHNDSLADAVIPERVELLYGNDHIVEDIHGLKFKITPFSFFQTNTKSAERLYDIGISMLDNINDKVVFDLYSGTGTISQIVAQSAKKVIGIEIVEEAVESAIENAKINGLDNVEFIAENVSTAVEKLNIKPDVIIIDPPRDGIHSKAIDKIIDFNPKEFLYISCNPKTQVDNLARFIERGYEIKKAVMVDQFPRTSHVEVIVKIEKL